MLDLESWQGMYSAARYPRRWMPTHPIGTGVSRPLSFFLNKEMERKYLQSSKWGSIPRYPSHIAMKGRDVLDPIGVQVLQLDLIVVQQTPEERVGRNHESALVEGHEGDDVAIGRR